MKGSNLNNYIKTYGWQGAAFILRFASMFIVAPFLTPNPSLYGIYAICISVSVYLNYADFGFLSSCEKYAAESIAQASREKEMEFIGFGGFILCCVIPFFSVMFLIFSIWPEQLISGLDSEAKRQTASHMFLILALFTPATAIQRTLSMLYSIRLESFVLQRISLVSSFLTIAAVPLLFRNGNYRIVEYFLLSQLLSLAAYLIGVLIAKKRYQYDMIALLRNIKFTKSTFSKTRELAFSGVYLTITWIVFFELDQVAIAKFVGVDKVALYTISITFLTLFRNIFSILFSPFNVRANHFVGVGDQEGLKRFVAKILVLTGPIVLISTVTFSLYSKSFILTWVGEKYRESIWPAHLLALYFSFSFLSYVASMIQLANERIKVMNSIGTINPLFFWAGVLLTYQSLGLVSFALFKLITALLIQFFCAYFIAKFFQISLPVFARKYIVPILLPLTVSVAISSILTHYLPVEKSKSHLLLVVSCISLTMLISWAAHYFASASFRNEAKELFVRKTHAPN